MNKISKKVVGWKGKLLSNGAKYTLIQYVLAVIPLHIMYVLNPPKYVLDQLEKTMSHLFWGENKKQTKEKLD